MLYDLQVDALLVCYGPLIVTILGFIGFAWLTDLDARRSYLRRMDLRPEDEAPEVPEPVITQRLTAETPAGDRVTIIPPGEPINGNGGTVITPTTPPPAPPPAAPVESAAPATPSTEPKAPEFEPPPIGDDLPPVEQPGDSDEDKS